MATALMLVLGLVLTAGTFVFVSAEFSLVAIDQAVVEKRAEVIKEREKAGKSATRASGGGDGDDVEVSAPADSSRATKD